MKRGQILGIAIAAVCGFGAFLGVRSIVTKQPRVVTKEVAQNTTQVLVAKTDIGLGHLVSPENFRWQEWPQSAINTNHIQRSARPNAPTDFTGAIARAPMQPVTRFTSAISSSRARAASWPRFSPPACVRHQCASRKRPAPAS